MAATLIAPDDVDLLGPLLVAEIEAYLRSLPAPSRAVAARPFTLDRLAVPAVNPYGSVVQQWHHGVQLPEPTLLDRIRGRRRVAQVTPAQHLDLLSKYIHQHGWLQGALWDASGAVCILGAQLRILAAGYSTPAVVERARELIGNEIGYRGETGPIDTWNDAEGRQAADVHQLLRRAAARTA
ncbi:DUF6197 family protein [Kitasatospora acidiphila]|uniref:DUF6197 family protein n=1 Tax=Kitasatospora acidiphila TaxID=2567942 RepID=UPI003C734C58